MTAIRLAIVGAGPAGAMVMYPPALAGQRALELVAVYDPDSENAQRLVDAVGSGRPMRSLEDVWASGAQAVVIASPVQFHRQQAIDGLNSGLHVLCEKPMARTPAGCRAMAAAARVADRILLIGFMKRYDRSFLRARELVAGGELGRMVEVRCDWSHGSPFPPGGSRAHPDTWGGTFQDHGSHTIDLCRWWLGEIDTVAAEMAIAFSDRRNEDVGVAVMRHREGAISTHNISRVRPGQMVERYDLIGTRGRLLIEYSGGPSYTSADPFRMTLFGHGGRRRNLTVRVKGNLNEEIARNGRYARELSHFADCIRGAAVPLTPAADGLAAIEAVNAAYLSAACGTKISLPLDQSIDLPAFFDRLRAARRTNR